ncbi:CC0125/CC1285 family lipoprotein [Brevundimonas sp. R86498]|uniref:CC0125/CC1285 family lipoprotein n=1 Tax=Brevundimonas sp. R86498 TaxID=3093845 RepID=UPI0037C65A1E
MKPSFKACLVVAAAVTLSACATSTAYAPAGFNGQRGGYAEQRLESDRYNVSFSGNSVTSREQVEMSLLLRAAELTTENGYDWFSTVNRATDRDTRFQTLSDPLYSRYGPYWGPSWRYYGYGRWSRWNDPFWGRPDFDIRQVDRYEATAEIVMGRGPKPAGDANAFDAREVISNLSGRVTRPQ